MSVAGCMSGQAGPNQLDSLSRLMLTGEGRQPKCQHQAHSALTIACHVGTEIGFEGRLDGALLYPSIYAQLLQSMCKLAVPTPRAAALVKEVIAPACVKVVWQVSLHTIWLDNNIDNNNDNKVFQYPMSGDGPESLMLSECLPN